MARAYDREDGHNKQEDKPLYELDLSVEDDLIDFVDRLWQRGKEYKYDIEHRWAQHLKHFEGEQWLYYDQHEQEFIYGPYEEDVPDRARMSINLLQGFVQAAVARASRSLPSWKVIPSTDDQDDRDRADHHTRILKFIWRELDMTTKMNELWFWVFTCHNCFLQCSWDPEAGSGMSVGPQDVLGQQGQPGQMGEQEQLGQPEGAPDPVNSMLESLGVDPSALNSQNEIDTFTGNNVAEIAPPFEIIPDPHVTRFDEAVYVLRSRRRTMSYLLDRYPDKKEKILELEPGSDDSGYDVYYNWFSYSGNKLGEGQEPEEQEPDESVIVHEFWHKPTNQYPGGFHAVLVNDLILVNEDNPYKGLPFVHFQEIPQPGSFWATGAFTQADEIQLAINQLISQKVEIMTRTANPEYLVDPTAGLEYDKWVSEPGALHEVNNINGIKLLEIPQVPQYVEKLLDSYIDYMHRIVGDYEVSMGKPSYQAQSGRAISMLHDANERRMAPILLSA